MRRLGHNGPLITTVGFGAWAAGGPWQVGWGPQNDEDSIDAIIRSVELGMNWIDTAAIYGVGHSEEVVGRALRKIGSRDVLVFTKCGRVIGKDGRPTGDLRPESIRAEIEASLKRLGVETIDLYQIHWPHPTELQPTVDAWATLAQLQDEGKCRWIGVSNFDVHQLQACEAVRHIDSLQPPYSLLRRDIESAVLPWCAAHGTGVLVYSPMQSGLLSGSFDISRLAPDDWRRRSPYFIEPALSENLAVVERLRPTAARLGCTVGQLAIAWTISSPAVTAAIVGARSPAQVEHSREAMEILLSRTDLAEIEAALTGG
jgi:aryl-alcohol dehydrogenase-like predicted oxidoreductase